MGLVRSLKILRCETGEVVGHYAPKTRQCIDVPVWSPCGRWAVMVWTNEGETRVEYTVHRMRP